MYYTYYEFNSHGKCTILQIWLSNFLKEWMMKTPCFLFWVLQQVSSTKMESCRLARTNLSLSQLCNMISIICTPKQKRNTILPEFGRTELHYMLAALNCTGFSQKTAFHKAFSPSPHRLWTILILSADLQIPLQLQSNEATHTLPAWAFHSQSGGVPQHSLRSSI